MGSIAMAIIYGLKVNLSVAMVAMLNHTAIGQLGEHHADTSSNATASAPQDEVCQGSGGPEMLEVSE